MACGPVSRHRVPLSRHVETEAIYPMKYSPKLSLLEEEGRARGRKKCAEIDRWRVPQMLLMSSLLRPLGGGGPAGGPLNAHTNVPLTAHWSPQRKSPIPQNTLLILLYSSNIQSMLLLVPLTQWVSFQIKCWDSSLFSLSMLDLNVAYCHNWG